MHSALRHLSCPALWLAGSPCSAALAPAAECSAPNMTQSTLGLVGRTAATQRIWRTRAPARFRASRNWRTG